MFFDSNDDQVWIAIQTHLRTKKRVGKETTFDCPMCVSRGETPDKRGRGGVTNSYDEIKINCFNCKFGARYKIGGPLSRNIRDFLSEIGVSESKILQISYWNKLRQQNTLSTDPNLPPALPKPIQKYELPKNSKTLAQLAQEDCQDKNFFDVIEYLYGRGIPIAEATTYYWSPERDKGVNRRIIIPCYSNDYDQSLVGWVARTIDKSVISKYLNFVPENFCSILARFPTPTERRSS